MRSVLHSLWNAPRAPGAPVYVWRDSVLVAVLVVTAVLEAALRADVPWRPIATAVAIALAFTLLWRRTHPLAVLFASFGISIALTVAAFAVGETRDVGLYTTAFQLLLPYALFRWATGRAVVIGSAIMLIAYVLGTAKDGMPLPDSAAAFVVMTVPAVLGLSVRNWATSRLREIDQVRFRERELLARELHDTVAHHVSAMVIRAQAGRLVAQAQPVAAVEALEIIEAEGSRTLAEMRTMVGALRDVDDAELAPVGGLADIERLARPGGDQPGVRVSTAGVPEDLSPSVEAALYRIAQESVTNAMRHARHAGEVVVRVRGDGGRVRLTVRDDGDPVPATRAPEGYGIVGMTERATLLGGTLVAGPGPDRGWVVEAVIPGAGAAG
jgi:signal transduction histidine kinase